MIDRKPTRAIYAKVKGCDKVTASYQMLTHLGHFSCQKDLH